MVIDNSGGGERAFDIYSLLLKERIIFLGGAINEPLAGLVVAQLLYLNSVDSKFPDSPLHSKSGRGDLSGMAIYDTMKMLSAPVSTASSGLRAVWPPSCSAPAQRESGLHCPMPPSTCTQPAAAPRAIPKTCGFHPGTGTPLNPTFPPHGQTHRAYLAGDGIFSEGQIPERQRSQTIRHY